MQRRQAPGLAGISSGSYNETRLDEGLGQKAQGQTVVLDDEHTPTSTHHATHHPPCFGVSSANVPKEAHSTLPKRERGP